MDVMGDTHLVSLMPNLTTMHKVPCRREQGLIVDDFDLTDSDPNCFWMILLQT